MISPSNYVKSLAKLAVGLGVLSALTLASGGSFFLTTWSAEAAPSFSPHLTSVVSMPVGPVAEPAQGRVVRVVDATVNRGQDNDVTITIASQGDENSLGFSLVFDPAQVNFVKAVSGLDAGSASVNLNLTQVGQGRVGISVALPAGQTFAGGIRSALIVTFAVLSTSNVNQTLVAFGDLPVVREVADANAAPLPATFADGTLTITPAVNEAARITSLSPSSATVGGPDFVLTINGANFVNGSVVKWNGQDRATTFVSSMQLTAQIPATDLETTDPASITVVTPPPGGGTSNAISFTINNPTPSLTNFSPNFAALNGPGFTLVVMGNNFVPGAIVRWGGQDRATSFVSSTQLTAVIPPSDLTVAGGVAITVINPAPGGGSSNSLNFDVRTPNPIPRLAMVSPDSNNAGSPGFTITVSGSGFTTSSVVRWNGQDRATTYFSGTQLTAAIPATDVGSPGTAAVTVFNPPPTGGTSNPITFTINPIANPVPVVASLDPAAVNAAGPSFTITVNGSNFVGSSVVRANGQDRATTYVSPNQLQAEIQAADIAAVGTVAVSVFNPAPAGGTSNAATLTVNNPTPQVTSLNPSGVTPGSPAFTLTVNGANFINGAVVRWNGQDRATSFVSAAQLTAQIPAADIAAVGTAAVSVVNPGPGGGPSNSVSFNISQPNPAPQLTALNPSSATVGGPGFTLTVAGANFVNGAVVQVNGQNRATSFVSATQLTAQIPAADIAAAGTANVTVVNPQPGGGPSNALAFTVSSGASPAPSVTSLSPSPIAAGTGPLTLTVNGANFTQGSVVRFNGQDRPTAFISGTQVTAQLTAADVAAPGTAAVTVFTPPPGGGVSNTVNLEIGNPGPSIVSLTPNSAAPGSPSFTLVVNGSGFISGSVVLVNGQARLTQFNSRSQIQAEIPAVDVSSPGTLTITVRNPQPGGGTSNAVSFPVSNSNPQPVISSINPNTGSAGSGGLTVTVTGSNFIPGSVVRFGGQDRATSFVSSTQLTAQLLAADLATPVTVQITVFNPPPDGGLSDTRLFTVTNPAPQVTALNPATVPAGGAAFNLTVTGSGFTSSSVVRVNGQDRATSFVSSTQLTAAIPSSDVAAPGTIAVSVFNSGPGGAASNSVNLTVGNPPAQITGLSPSSVSAGGAAFALTVTGSGFVQGSVVRVNGQDRATSFVSTTQLTAAILAADIAAAGSLSIVVVNPAPGGGTSNAATLQVGILAPVISSLGPNTAAVGTAGLTLTVTGSGFVSGAVVRWNGQDRATTFVSGTQLTAAIPATDLASIGTASVTVVNPGGGQSNAVVFTTTQTSCVAICYDSAEYWVLNPARMPDGTVSIGRPGYLAPVRIGSNRTEVQRALAGGPSALQQLNSEWVALQLNVIVGVGGFSTAQGVGLLNSSLSCQGANIAPVALASGVTLSSSSQLGDLVDQIKSAIQGNRTGDMELLAPIARLINGDSALSRCRISRASDN